MITAYYRPTSLDEALDWLTDPNTVPLAGGTLVNTPAFLPGRNFAVVDLQNLGLDRIDLSGTDLVIGAAVTLQALLVHPQIPDAVKKAIGSEAPLNVRNAATIGGTLVAADGRSPLAAVLLALDVELELAGLQSRRMVRYGELLPLRNEGLRGNLVLGITIPLSVDLAWEYVSRTPADKPLISVALAHWPGGRLRLVVGGFGPAPLLGLDGADVPGLPSAARSVAFNASDDWGSAEYRQEMAVLLAERCWAQLSV